MKPTTIRLIAITFLASMMLAGSAKADNGKFPVPSTNFVARLTYTNSFNSLWDATLNALDDSRIAVVSTDKGSGIIETDYIGGPGRLIAGGFLGSQSTRYKFNLTLRSQSNGTVRLNIICTIESSIQGSSGSTPYRDVTASNLKVAKQLETWLYEQIEQELAKT
ncbi:MAG TPA: hypothetical protein VMD27_07430 [Candidatus Aquilonibacter sp.]|nr:hypothetical protein [Candidatus Aquilonibacter sp.]